MKKLILLSAVCSAFMACNMGGNKNCATNNVAAKNKAGMMKFYDEVFNKHNPAMFDSVTTADFVEHESDPNTPPTRDGTKKLFAMTFAAYPDVTEKVINMVADSQFVYTHYEMTGTNTAAFMGMPATGKKIDIEGVDIVRFVNGKGVEHWGYNEEMKMMMQMGMMPGMGGSDSSKAKMPEGDKKKM